MSTPNNPDFDRDDGVTALEEEILADLERAQELARTLACYENDLGRAITLALMRLVGPGTIIGRHRGEFGRVHVAHGADRRAQRFEVVTPPHLIQLKLDAPHLSVFSVDAYPLNEDGKRLSGRPGNTRSYASRKNDDTVALHIELVAERFEESRLENDIFTEFIHRAAIATTKQEPRS